MNHRIILQQRRFCYATPVVGYLSCLLGKYHKTTQAGCQSFVNKPPVKWWTELYIKTTQAGCWSVINKPLVTWWTELYIKTTQAGCWSVINKPLVTYMMNWTVLCHLAVVLVIINIISLHMSSWRKKKFIIIIINNENNN